MFSRKNFVFQNSLIIVTVLPHFHFRIASWGSLCAIWHFAVYIQIVILGNAKKDAAHESMGLWDIKAEAGDARVDHVFFGVMVDRS